MILRLDNLEFHRPLHFFTNLDMRTLSTPSKEVC